MAAPPKTSSYNDEITERTGCIETARLVLRAWQPEDLLPLVAVNQDSRVMEFLGPALEAAQTKAMLDRFSAHLQKYGYGPLVCVLKETGVCIGVVGLHVPQFEAAFMPCTEILWRLGPSYWGKGYATEAAQAVLQAAFDDYGLPEVVAFTALPNLRSQRVMERLGMRQDPKYDFNHPKLSPPHPLSFHVFYRITREQYAARLVNIGAT